MLFELRREPRANSLDRRGAGLSVLQISVGGQMLNFTLVASEPDLGAVCIVQVGRCLQL